LIIKNTLIGYFIVGFTLLCYPQQTLYESISHDGIEREYILYVPEIYTGYVAVPLLLNFHGLTMTAAQQMWYGDFRSIADTAGFLTVHPQGTLFNGVTHWNVGGWTIGSTVDDVGFTGALIDSLSTNYNIDATRVYATGMSNGGYMSFLLACQLSERIAAIASVTGSMTPETYNNGNPQHPMPILQIHGTADNTVPYNGATWSKSIEDVLQYWVGYNNCYPLPQITSLPDIDPDDGSTVDYIHYGGGDNGVSVEHYKVIGGGHTWPGSAFGGAGTNYDIDASVEIWRFFSRYNINGLIAITDIENAGKSDLNASIYPTPTSGHIQIEMEFSKPLEYDLFSSTGERIMTGMIISNNQLIDLSQLPPNIYILRVGNKTIKIVKTK
jgi:polyhydroxybutyrate depolymerase